MKFDPRTINPMNFLAIMKWKDGGETVKEWFHTLEDCLIWIQNQNQPKNDEFVWCVGEY